MFQKTNYVAVYHWFEYLHKQGHYVNAFVIMPNHVHAIISFTKTEKSINRIIGDGKRFMAYEIVKSLKSKGEEETLFSLRSMVTKSDEKRNKKHDVFEPSFDWKLCESSQFQNQKLHYIHNNPVRAKLVKQAEDYQHSSARQYLGLNFDTFAVAHIGEMQNFNFGHRYD